MAERRVCDMCSQPYLGRGDRSNCTQACPYRRGLGRGDVARELDRGHIVDGVHPRSRVIMEAQARLMMREGRNAADIQAVLDQVAELENRLRNLEQRRDEMRTILFRLAFFHAGGHDANQRGNPSQPESEPAEHDG